VGDGVYTSATSAALPEPMFYGTIIKAELDETAREWTIEIEPAVKPEKLRSVAILKQSINPVRISGN
jgi:cell shape-determining protein MreC